MLHVAGERFLNGHWNWQMILLTDVPAKPLRLEEVLVLVQERWQMELLSKLCKQDGQIDEWRTAHPWRVVCELYAKRIGMVLQHWLLVQPGRNNEGEWGMIE